ncbi:hypothetical protein OR221_0847 [Microbacterium laevaniformans OR221]|nr:hypothetical protein OR221_0847 [Microbacterium laevaniformans OR221]
MGVNDKLAATFHPRTFTCDCGAVYTSAIAAMYCCDVAAPGPADDDHKSRPSYERGYD